MGAAHRGTDGRFHQAVRLALAGAQGAWYLPPLAHTGRGDLCHSEAQDPGTTSRRLTSQARFRWRWASSGRRARRAKESVKSIHPTTENWPRKLYKYSMNIDTSTEDKHETNHINNKYNDMNMNTCFVTLLMSGHVHLMAQVCS